MDSLAGFSRVFLRKFRIIYMCILVVYLVAREVTPLQFLISNPLVSAAILATGAVLIIWDLFTEKNCVKERVSDFFLGFIFICGVASIVNIKYGITGNIKTAGILLLEYYLFFASGLSRSKEQIKQELKCIFLTLQIAWFAVVFLSVQMYYFSIEFAISGGSWGIAAQGFNSEYVRLWGILQDPNYASITSLICIYTTAYLMKELKRKSYYILGTVNIVFQACYIVLGGSRAAALMLLSSVILYCVYRILWTAKWNPKVIIKGIAVSCAGAVLCYGCIFALRVAIPYSKKLVGYIPKSTSKSIVRLYTDCYKAAGVDIVAYGKSYIDLDDPNLDDGLGLTLAIGRTDKKSDLSNGRIKRWVHTLQIFSVSPIIGVSPRNLMSFAQENCPETLMAQYGIATHNGYLDVLVSTGVLGAVCLFGIIIFIIYDQIKKARKQPFDRTKATMFLILHTLAGSAIFVSDIFLVFTVGAFLFWTGLGYLYHFDGEIHSPGFLCRIFRRKKRDTAV